tara:strand:+ start:16257 stop:16469 length:213 start_codon:yes stop_codon:yes gene_type:complete
VISPLSGQITEANPDGQRHTGRLHEIPDLLIKLAGAIVPDSVLLGDTRDTVATSNLARYNITGVFCLFIS